jgi:hypothetical protein
MVQDMKKMEYIIDSISNFKIIPYSEVKKNLDIVSHKTRKVLGVKLRQEKPSCVINNEYKA